MHPLLRFLRYAAGVTVRPRVTFRALLTDSACVCVGLGGLLTLSAAYAVSIFLGLRRHPE